MFRLWKKKESDVVLQCLRPLKSDELCPKHDANATMILYVERGDMYKPQPDSIQQFILPLCPVSVEYDDMFATIYVGVKRNESFPPLSTLKSLVIVVCDDPTQSWAGDWSHMGAFRIRLDFRGVVVLDEDMLTFKCLRTNVMSAITGDVIVPDGGVL